jgi:hypothetical protein
LLTPSTEVALMMEAESTFEALKYNNPEYSHLHTRRRENLKSYHYRSLPRVDSNIKIYIMDMLATLFLFFFFSLCGLFHNGGVHSVFRMYSL